MGSRRHRIRIHLINHSLDSHPHGQIGENVDDAALIGEWRLLQDGHVFQETVVDDVLHDLVHEVDLAAVQLGGVEIVREGGLGGGHVKRSARDLAQISDDLCRENGLSVIENPQHKTVTYDQWQGNQRKFTHRDELRMIMDAALRMQPDSFDALMQLLEDAGCLIKRSAHISIKPPEGERYIRLDTLGPEYHEASLRQSLTGKHAHIPKIPRGDFTESQIRRLVDIEAKLRAGKGKGYQVWAERNNIEALSQMVIFLKEHRIGSLEELNDQIQGLTKQRNTLKAAIREKQTQMKEINRQRQAIRDYSRTKNVYTQYQESGWSSRFYQEHRQEIEDHKKAQAVYGSLGGKLPTLKELSAEYDKLKEEKADDQTALDELKPGLTDLKHIRYNYGILERDAAPNDHHSNRHRDEAR